MSWHKPWWKGQRGEWYVVAQAGLFLLIAIGPPTWPGAQPWSFPYDVIGKAFGGLLISAGVILSLFAARRLGNSLSPLPHPMEDAELTVSGPYRLVRHPIYSGLIMASLGWGLWLNGWLTMGYGLLLLIFFDIKSRREEKWLVAKFPAYRDYQQSVRKLIPAVY